MSVQKKIINLVKRGTDSLQELALLYFSSVALAGISFSFFEKKDIVDSIWWSFVTALTIGYGDYYPESLGGRITAIILMHIVTLFIIPVIVGRVASEIIKNKNEFTDKEQKDLKKDIKSIIRHLELEVSDEGEKDKNSSSNKSSKQKRRS